MSKSVHINNEKYQYKVFKSGVEIRDPENKRIFVDMSTLTGWSWAELERANYKGFPLPQVKPSRIKEWIIKGK